MIILNRIVNIMKQLVFSTLLLIFMGVASECCAQELAKAKVIEMTGEVRFKNPEEVDWHPVLKGMELVEGASLFVGPDSDCQLAFGDDFKSVTRIKQDSRVLLKSISSQPQLELSTGEIFALVRDLKKESSFRVSTPTAVATVRGTAFSFAAEGIASEVNSTLQVYEHTVGLNPIDQPDKETPIEEGHGAMMGSDGIVQKEFELSPEDIQAGKEFMSEALDVMTLEKPEVPEAKSEAKSSDEAVADDDDKKMGGPNSPGPDSGDTSDAQTDSAVDGVVMDMARDSETSKSETFGGGAMNQMFEHLADLNGDGENPGKMNPAMYAETVKSAIEQTGYFQNMPPDVQERMMETIDSHAENGGPMGSGPEGGIFFEGQIQFAPDDGVFNAGMDPSLVGLPPDTFFNPNDLASFINDNKNLPPRELQSIINFMFAIRQDYNNYLSSNGGSDAGYYGSQRTLTNFNFVKDDVAYTGSVLFTPIDADPSPGTGVHDHSGPDFLHLTNVVVRDDPSGTAGSVVVAPGTIEVPTV